MKVIFLGLSLDIIFLLFLSSFSFTTGIWEGVDDCCNSIYLQGTVISMFDLYIVVCSLLFTLNYLLQILEPCRNSIAYQPPNPWTMGILGLLAEIYVLPNLKMNLKFDIEVHRLLLLVIWMNLSYMSLYLFIYFCAISILCSGPVQEPWCGYEGHNTNVSPRKPT